MAVENSRPYRSLALDNIVSSLPELGPSAPDGGYGWIILLAATAVQVLLSSVLVTYGLFKITAIDNTELLWNNNIILIPILYYTFWTLTDPWSRTIISISQNQPRAIAVAGILLVAAGVLASSFSMTPESNISTLFLPGVVAGIGASLVQQQSEILLQQYFRLKAATINCVLYMGTATGRIVFPFIITSLRTKYDKKGVLMIYAAIIIQSFLLLLFYRKPQYKQTVGNTYTLLQDNDEEDEVYTSPNAANINTTNAEIHEESDRNNDTNNDTVEIETSANLQVEINQTRNAVMSSFIEPEESLNSRYDTDRIERLEDNQPRPLFSEVDLRTTNLSYAFDNNQNITNDDVNIITYPSRTTTNYIDEFKQFSKPRFYMCLLLVFCDKIATLMFWTLLPSCANALGNTDDSYAAFIICVAGLSSLCFSVLIPWLPATAYNRSLLLTTFCVISSIGFFVLSAHSSPTWHTLSAVFTSFFLTGISALVEPLLSNTLGRPGIYKSHMLLCTLTGIAIITTTVTHSSTISICFKLTGLLIILTGGVWLSNTFFHKIKDVFSK